MVTDEEVLKFFRDDLSIPVNWKGKAVPLELDTHLQDYAAPDELPYTIEDFGKKFKIDVSVIDMNYYCPIVKIPFIKQLINGKKLKEEKLKNRPEFTVRMFAESAKAGRWLYD